MTSWGFSWKSEIKERRRVTENTKKVVNHDHRGRTNHAWFDRMYFIITKVALRQPQQCVLKSTSRSLD
jgi:hypothetical protein